MADLQGGTIEWQLKVNQDAFKSGLDQVKGQLDQLGTGLKRTEGGLRAHEASINRVAKSLVALAAGYVGIRAISSFIGSSINQFNEYQRSATTLTTAILNQKGATFENVQALMAQAQALSNVGIFSQQQIMMAQATIATFDGMTTDLVTKAIPAWQNYTAMQYGSIDSLEEAKASAESFGKALVGKTKALTDQGFVFTDLQKKILESGDASERMSVVMEAMTYASDAAADQANTLQGRMKVLSNQFDNTQLAVGGMAQMLKVELLNAFIQSTADGETWGENMLSIAQQIGVGFVNMANVAGQAIIGIMALANRAAAAVSGIKAAGLGASEKFATDKGGVMGFLGKYWLGEKRSSEEINNQIAQVGETVFSLDEEQRKLGESSLELQQRLDGVKTKIQGIGSVGDLMAIGLKKAGGGFRDMGQEGARSAEDTKKAAQEMEKMRDKVLDFRQKELESTNKVKEAMDKQKIKLEELKEQYDKAIASIKKNIDELNASFDKNEASARESFLGQLASATETAKRTIAEREKMIQDELNKEAGADQAKIAQLQAENAKEREILERHGSLISEAEKIEAEKKTAVGVENLINRFNAEREEARKQFEQDKAELQTQLSEREAEYKKSQATVKADTIKTIADIRSAYIKMFDDLHRELAKLGEGFLNLMKLGAITAPGESKEASAAFAALTKNITKRQYGGPVMPNRPYLVGEKGPEVIVPRRAGSVLPHGANNFNFYVSEKVDMQYVLGEVQRVLGAKGLEADAGIH